MFFYAISVQLSSASHLQKCQAESAKRKCLQFAGDSIRSEHTVFSHTDRIDSTEHCQQDKGLVLVHV